MPHHDAQPWPGAIAASGVAGARARPRRWTSVPVAVAPADGPPAAVRYRWDADTEILAATVVDRRGGGTATTSVELESRDGAWLTLELRAGRFCGLEIAVWPTVRRRSDLAPPTPAEVGDVLVPSAARVDAAGGTTSMEVDTALVAQADRRGRTFHFRLGRLRPARAVQVGHDILLEVDDAGELSGLWLLGVPPLPLPV